MVSFDIWDGNPGALTFVMTAYDLDMVTAERSFQRMADNNIVGCRLYMLWNDCCGRNTELSLKVMLNCSIESIRQHINYENGRGIAFTPKELSEVGIHD